LAYDLLVSDLDGTIVDSAMALDPRLVAAFRRAAGLGLAITVATGRMPQSAERYCVELDIRAPAIYYNGALIRDPAGGPDLLAEQLPRGILAEVLEVFTSAPAHPIFFRDEELYCLEVTPFIRQFCADEGLRANVIPDPAGFLRLGGFVKGLFIGHPRDLSILRGDLERAVGPAARVVRTAESYLELLPAGVSKGAALHHLAGHLGVPIERVVAVGDHDNDIEMIRAAGLGVAMPHAPERVRAAADRVAPADEDGGLLRLLAELVPGYFASTDTGGQ
jgi:hypothetical protein